MRIYRAYGLGIPVVRLFLLYLGVSGIKLNIRKKGTLVIQGLYGVTGEPGLTIPQYS